MAFGTKAQGVLLLALTALALPVHATPSDGRAPWKMPLSTTTNGSCSYPVNCPNEVLPRADKQTWAMNASTIIMPCNNTGFTDPQSTKGWGIVDFDCEFSPYTAGDNPLVLSTPLLSTPLTLSSTPLTLSSTPLLITMLRVGTGSNAKGTGTAPGWVKHSPMDDEEMLFKQVQMTTSASPGTTVWVYRCSIYAYPWYTSVRKLLDDPAYAPWFVNFKKQAPWKSPKCDDNFNPPKCSEYYHMQEQSPGYPHGDGDCAAPGCDCGKAPCGFYLWNHSSTAVVYGKTFQEWFIQDYMLNQVGMSPLVSGFFWDDFWPSVGQKFGRNGHAFPDSVGTVAQDTGLDQDHHAWAQITDAYHVNMDALRTDTLKAGKFAWQLMWTGGNEQGGGSTCPQPIVRQRQCAEDLRGLCNKTAPPQTRAMMYSLTAHEPTDPTGLPQDLANFLLIRGPFAWLGHGWKGCSREYPFPKEFNLDYGQPVDQICEETAPNSGVFTREWSNAVISMDCNKWAPNITWKK